MTSQSHFQWHPEARLFAADQCVARVSTGEFGMQCIPSHPVPVALEKLGAAVLDQHPFWVTDMEHPPHTTVEPGMFITQTGGSSGVPKGILREQASWVASFEVNADRFGLTPQD